LKTLSDLLMVYTAIAVQSWRGDLGINAAQY